MQDWEGMLLKHSQGGESWGTAKHFIQYSDEEAYSILYSCE